MTRAEMRLAHGTPAEFAAAVNRAVGDFITVSEADEAIAKYQADWDAAA